MRKIRVVSALVTSAINTGIVTLVITLVNSGLPLPLLLWLETWLLAFSLIAPLSLFLPARVQRLVTRIFQTPAEAEAGAEEMQRKKAQHNETACR